MNNVKPFLGHKYTFVDDGVALLVTKNKKELGFITNKAPGITGYTYGVKCQAVTLYGVIPVYQFLTMEDGSGYPDMISAVKALELDLLYVADKDNIGATRDWKDYYSVEHGRRRARKRSRSRKNILHKLHEKSGRRGNRKGSSKIPEHRSPPL